MHLEAREESLDSHVEMTLDDRTVAFMSTDKPCELTEDSVSRPFKGSKCCEPVEPV